MQAQALRGRSVVRIHPRVPDLAEAAQVFEQPVAKAQEGRWFEPTPPHQFWGCSSVSRAPRSTRLR